MRGEVATEWTVVGRAAPDCGVLHAVTCPFSAVRLVVGSGRRPVSGLTWGRRQAWRLWKMGEIARSTTVSRETTHESLFSSAPHGPRMILAGAANMVRQC